MKKPVKILLFFAVYKRLEVLEIFLQGLERLKKYDPDRFEIIPFAVCSNDDERRILTDFNVSTVKYSNQYIGKKKNIGLSEALKHIEFDYLFESGSDDLFKNEILDLYEDYFFKSACFGMTSCYHLELQTMKNTWFNIPYPIGAGRCISREAVENFGTRYNMRLNESVSTNNSQYGKGKVMNLSYKAYQNLKEHGTLVNISYDYRLWNNTANIGLDAISEFNLNMAGYVVHKIKTTVPYILDLKTSQNIHTFIERDKSEYTTKQLLNHFKSEKSLIENYASRHPGQ